MPLDKKQRETISTVVRKLSNKLALDETEQRVLDMAEACLRKVNGQEAEFST